MKNGFTLAEVLITLGIIGVVAAITIPSLVADYKKEVLHKQFLKTYSELSQATVLFQNFEDVSVQEYSLDKSLNYTLRTFMKYYTGISKQTNIVTNAADYEKYLGYAPKTLAGGMAAMACDTSGFIADISGRIFLLDGRLTLQAKIGPKICVDINGKKAPNKYGYDWFVFAFTGENKIVPYIGKDIFSSDSEDLEEPEVGCNYNGGYRSSYTCAYFAIQNKSPVDGTKSYWKDFLK